MFVSEHACYLLEKFDFAESVGDGLSDGRVVGRVGALVGPRVLKALEISEGRACEEAVVKIADISGR